MGSAFTNEMSAFGSGPCSGTARTAEKKEAAGAFPATFSSYCPRVILGRQQAPHHYSHSSIFAGGPAIRKQ
jgi:hypothetical protein